MRSADAGLLALAWAVAACGGSTPGDAGQGGPPPSCPASVDVSVEPARGLYDEPVVVTATTSSDEVTLRYTLDGAAPTGLASASWTGELELEGTPERPVATLRLAAFVGAERCGPVATHSYVFPAAVVVQSGQPDEAPAQWGAGGEVTDGDYAMDPLVVDDPAYAGGLDAGLRAIASVSLVLAPGDLWGPQTGLYMNPEATGSTWERAASLELLAGDGAPPGEPQVDDVQVDAGLRIQGGSSTLDWKVPKLSLRLVFKSEWGPSKLEHDVFPGSPVDRFDTLVLDAHLNQTWVHPEHDQRERANYLRDRFVSDLLLDLGVLAPRGRFVHLYLNGLYWGLYELHERPDDAFCAEHLGGGKADWDVLKHDGAQVVAGEDDAWDQLMALLRGGVEDPGAYAAVAGLVDLDAFVDYMLVNLWAGNTDWPRHNWYAGRRREPAGRWRFSSWDAEHVMEELDDDRTWVANRDTPGELWKALMANADFRDQASQRAAALLLGAGPLSGERGAARTLYASLAEGVRDAVVLESARWGDSRRPGEPYTRDVEWQAELDWLLDTWFVERAAIVVAQLRDRGLALREPSDRE